MKNENKKWFLEAEKVAQDGLCARAKCGAVIVSRDGQLIGRGYNAPPRDDLANAKCRAEFDRTKKSKYDITCCVHAEWRAIADALATHSDEIAGSSLYYVRLGDDGKLRHSGEPFCTVCSRLALDHGIAKFGLWHESGIVMYDAQDYNERSYSYHTPAA